MPDGRVWTISGTTSSSGSGSTVSVKSERRVQYTHITTLEDMYICSPASHPAKTNKPEKNGDRRRSSRYCCATHASFGVNAHGRAVGEGILPSQRCAACTKQTYIHPFIRQEQFDLYLPSSRVIGQELPMMHYIEV